jgi:hypothetical protein
MDEFDTDVEHARIADLFRRSSCCCPVVVSRGMLQKYLDGIEAAKAAGDEDGAMASACGFAKEMDVLRFVADDAPPILAEIRRALAPYDVAMAKRVGGTEARTRRIERLRDDIAALKETLRQQARTCMVHRPNGGGLSFDSSVDCVLPPRATLDRLAREIDDVEDVLVQLADRHAFERDFRREFLRLRARYDFLSRSPPSTDAVPPADRPKPDLRLSAERQRDLLDQLKFEVAFQVEIVREDIRLEDARAEEAQRMRYVSMSGTLRPSVDEELEHLAGAVDRARPLISDPALRTEFQSDVVDLLTDVQKSYAAKHAR